MSDKKEPKEIFNEKIENIKIWVKQDSNLPIMVIAGFVALAIIVAIISIKSNANSKQIKINKADIARARANVLGDAALEAEGAVKRNLRKFANWCGDICDYLSDLYDRIIPYAWLRTTLKYLLAALLFVAYLAAGYAIFMCNNGREITADHKNGKTYAKMTSIRMMEGVIRPMPEAPKGESKMGFVERWAKEIALVTIELPFVPTEYISEAYLVCDANTGINYPDTTITLAGEPTQSHLSGSQRGFRHDMVLAETQVANDTKEVAGDKTAKEKFKADRKNITDNNQTTADGLNGKQQVLNAANDDVQAKGKPIQTDTADVAKKSKAYADANNAYDAAKKSDTPSTPAELQKLKTARNNAKGDLDAANDTLATDKKALSEAQAKQKTAQDDVNAAKKAVKAIDAANKAYSTANVNFTNAQQKLKEDEVKSDHAVAVYTKSWCKTLEDDNAPKD